MTGAFDAIANADGLAVPEGFLLPDPVVFVCVVLEVRHGGSWSTVEMGKTGSSI